jgi:tRNA-dihydrouridine synthase B
LRLHLAPIRGITDCIFRTKFAGHFHGFESAVSPFISTVKGKAIKPSHIKDVLPENNRTMPIVPQIIGNNPEDFVILAKTLFDLGYQEVNWNIGCPFPQVTKKKRGAGLLPHPEKIGSFLDHVLARMPNKLSVKTRLGLVSKDEMQGWLPVLNAFPISEIIMHPRTGKQLYKGEADLEGFEAFAQGSINPVVYNGDIVSKDSFAALRQRFPKINQWMIGRGAIANPLLAEILQGKAPDASAMYPRIKAFHDDLLEAYSAVYKDCGAKVDKMKGIWFYLSRSFTDSKVLLRRIQKTKRWEHYKALIEDIFTFQ